MTVATSDAKPPKECDCLGSLSRAIAGLIDTNPDIHAIGGHDAVPRRSADSA